MANPTYDNKGFILLEALLGLSIILITTTLIQGHYLEMRTQFTQLTEQINQIEAAENQVHGGPLAFPATRTPFSPSLSSVQFRINDTLVIEYFE